MKSLVTALITLLAAAAIAPSNLAASDVQTTPAPRSTSFNTNWRFTKGDAAGAAESLSYANLKPTLLAATTDFATTGTSPQSELPNPQSPYAKADFDDSAWQSLDLPHDWAITGPFDQDIPGENGKLPYAGVGWYRKHFNISADDKGQQLYLDVDGAMSFASVWINGRYVGGWPNGYTSWRVDLTSHINFGGENVVAIRLDNPPASSRWYPGGGIYRNVWLTKTAPIHIARWGTTITTPEISKETATVVVEVKVANRSNAAANVDVAATFSLAGEPVASTGTVSLAIGANSTATATLHATIPKPRLWSPESPSLYSALVTITSGATGSASALLDRDETHFGIRTIKFTPNDGLLLNDKPTEIRGVCLHHDLGALGAAFNLRARARQLEKLKELGCNAIRTSHNPPEPELLELCDRMGFLVMVEAFDAWQLAKRENDYHILFDDWHERDLRAMIRRDRNHPSVILWSLGNEVYEQKDGGNVHLVQELAAIAHSEDPMRPVNMALHIVDASTNGFQNAVDVFGYNYTPFGYAQFRKDNPQIPLVGSETSSCTSTRGEYFFPVNMDDKRTGRVNYQVTSYDYSAPKWAMAPDEEFKGQDENPFVAGEFVWTGFDYLGEPTPYDQDAKEMPEFTDDTLRTQAAADLESLKKVRVPSRSSYFGIFDLCGFPKDRFYLYQSRWQSDLPMAHILPHWNWPDRVGQITPVHVYTSGDEAELFLNGRSLGRRKKGQNDYRLRWDDIVYEPGELQVIAYRNGRGWATDTVTTTGPPAALKLESDRKQMNADSEDLAFITCSVVDAEGRTVPTAKNTLRFTIEGPAELIATDNGDPTSHVPFQSPTRNAFNGLALAILRPNVGADAPITIKCESNGLRSAEIQLVSPLQRTGDKP